MTDSATLLPMAFLRHKPLWAWHIPALGLILAGFADGSRGQPWPWNPTQIVVGLIVLFVVGLG